MPRINNKPIPVEFEREEPAETVDGREQQLINLAIRRVEEQIRTGTASAQVLVHYLKMGSRRENLENEIKEKQARLVGAKTDAIEQTGDAGRLAQEAIEAFTNYSPTDDE